MPRNVLTRSRPVLQTQATRLKDEYPELFTYLEARDQALRRMLAHIPNAEDVELSAAVNHWNQVGKILRDLDPGVAEIAGNTGNNPRLDVPPARVRRVAHDL